MNEPIYSNYCGIQENLVREEHYIPLLQAKYVDEINQKLTFKKHGFFVFIQYQENPYIVNGFAEAVFWEMVNALYKLLHDSGNEQLNIFLGIVEANGMQTLQPFAVTGTEDKKKLEQIDEFRKRVNDLRLYHSHNMKPDSPEDSIRQNKVEAWLKKYSREGSICLKNQEWERCITYLHKQSVELERFLDKRMLFLENNSASMQKERISSLYYDALKKYYLRNMLEIIKDYVKKERKSHAGFAVNIQLISSWKNTADDQIANKAVELIKYSTRRVDPYRAVLEAVDTVFEEKGYWGD